MIAFIEHPESNSYSWEYRGGCYGESNEVAYYEPAVLGEEYSFTFVPIEVREDESLSASLQNVGSEVSSGASPIFYGLYLIFLIIGIGAAVLFGVFFAKAKLGLGSSSGGSMKHQKQVDDPY